MRFTDIDDYGFVFHGWVPACRLPVEVEWFRMIHLGLPFIGFSVEFVGMKVTCRVDPCSCVDAMAPYAEMVRRDLDHEIALRLITLRSLVGGKMEQEDRMLKWFAYEHLPANLQEVSKPFGELAKTIEATVFAGPERTVAFRKLLEAKDAAVRAKLHPGG